MTWAVHSKSHVKIENMANILTMYWKYKLHMYRQNIETTLEKTSELYSNNFGKYTLKDIIQIY